MPGSGTQEQTLATEDTRRENDCLIKDYEPRLHHFCARNGSNSGQECAWKVGPRFGGGRYSVLWCSHKCLGKKFIQLLNLAEPARPGQQRGSAQSIIATQTGNPNSSGSLIAARTFRVLLR